PASFTQERLWSLSQLDGGDSIYNVTWATRFNGSPNVPALNRSLCELVKRHQSLRTTFELANGRLSQVIRPAAFQLKMSPLEDIPRPEREQKVYSLIKVEAGRPFDLATGPLFRATLFSLGPSETFLVQSTHLIVWDTWSWEILTRDLEAFYRAFA